MDGQPDVRVGLHELVHYGRQGIARLSVRCGDREDPGRLIEKFICDLANVPSLGQNLPGHPNDFLPPFGQRHKVLAVALKEIEAQLLFK